MDNLNIQTYNTLFDNYFSHKDAFNVNCEIVSIMPTSSKDNTLNNMLSLNVVLQFALTSNHSDIKHACFSDAAPRAELRVLKNGSSS